MVAESVTRGLSLHERIERDRDAALPPSEAKLISRYRQYARGRNPGPFGKEQIRLILSLSRNRFSDNICRRILAVTTGRTEFTGWDVPSRPVKTFLDELFVKNGVADMQSDITWATLRDGNHAVNLRWKLDASVPGGGRVTFHRERWWDGDTGVFIAYDGPNNPIYAVKEWWEYGSDNVRRKRRTVYFPDQIQRYIERGQGFVPYFDPDIDDLGPGRSSWVKVDGSPLGIPVIHFPNGSDDDTPYGASDLDGGVLAFQDQINSIQYDMSAASTMTGFQQTYSTGTTLETDQQGNPKAPEVGPGQHWHADESDAAFGVLPPGDMSALETAYRLKISSVSRMTGTPAHFFTGQWPSGEALIRAEIDLVDKSRRLSRSIGPSYATLAHRSTEIFNAFAQGVETLDEGPLIRPIFTDPARRDLQAMTQMATQQAEYTSKKERLRMTGRTEDQITQILREIEEEQQASLEAQQSFFGGNPAATGIALPPDEV